MRILISALQPNGGIKTFLRYVYGQPEFEDCHLALLAPDKGLSEYLGYFLPEGRLEVIEARQPSGRFIQQVHEHLKRESFDLIHSHGFSAGLLTELGRIGTGVPHLMTAHDVLQSGQFQGIKGRLKKIPIGLLFRRMTGIHTATDDSKANFSEFFPGVDQSRVHSILHGVDTEYFRQSGVRDLKGELRLAPDTPVVGFFGRFMSPKGFRVLVDAMEQIIGRGLIRPLPHVITFGWGAFIREDYDYLKQKGLGDYFHQMEQTNDMASALKGVDIVAMPSRWEACGLLAMEALASGKPLIGSDCTGLREVLEGTPAKKIRTGSSESLVAALVEEFESLPAREKEFKDYQDVAVERFHIRRPARELRNLYQKLVRQRKKT